MSSLMRVDFDRYIETELQHYNLGCREVAFFRELSQNSLDAIAQRRQIDPSAEGLLQFTITNVKEGVEVKVRDTGIGMSQQRLEALNCLGHSDKSGVASNIVAGGFGAAKVLIYMAQKDYEIVSCPHGNSVGHQFHSPGLRYLNGKDFSYECKEIQDVPVGTTSTIIVDDKVLFPSQRLSQEDIILRLDQAVRQFAKFSFANDVEFRINKETLSLKYNPIQKQLIWPVGPDIDKYPGIKAYRLEYEQRPPPPPGNFLEANKSLIVRATGMYMFTGDFYTHNDNAYYLLEIDGNSTRYLKPSRDGLIESVTLALMILLSAVGQRFSSADDHAHFDVIVGSGDRARSVIRAMRREFERSQECRNESGRKNVAEVLRGRYAAQHEKAEKQATEKRATIKRDKDDVDDRIAKTQDAKVRESNSKEIGKLDANLKDLTGRSLALEEQRKNAEIECAEIASAYKTALTELAKMERSSQLPPIESDLGYTFAVRVSLPNYETDQRFLDWTEQKPGQRLLSFNNKCILEIWTFAVDILVDVLAEIRRANEPLVRELYDVGVFIAEPNKNKIDTLGIFIKERFPNQILINPHGFDDFLQDPNSLAAIDYANVSAKRSSTDSLQEASGNEQQRQIANRMDIEWQMKADYIWNIALHEVTHILVSNHDEDFTTLQNDLITHSITARHRFQRNTIPRILDRLKAEYASCAIDTETSVGDRGPGHQRSQTEGSGKPSEMAVLTLPKDVKAALKSDMDEATRAFTTAERHTAVSKAIRRLTSQCPVSLCHREYENMAGRDFITLCTFAREAFTYDDPGYGMAALQKAFQLGGHRGGNLENGALPETDRVQ